jgi:predicted AlkP superfamily phosphohydrolase/phosphomutase
METDRLLHFFWGDIESGGASYRECETFFERLDHHIAGLIKKLSPQDRLLILSDHGFCGIKAEVQLNAWLEQQGLLRFNDGEKKLPNYHKDSVCYSLIPGRIYINLKDREEKGTIDHNSYENVRTDIKNRLLKLEDPETNERIIDKVFFREEIYSGPLLEQAADIIIHPVNGYDLKASPTSDDILVRTALDGMHTYDDAFACGINVDTSTLKSIQHVAELIS